jgi:cilia- and flagella-associated protein 57
MDNP